MSWFVKSADLNPIELVWDELGRKVRAKLLQESLAEQSSVYLQSLLERMPRICEAVIAAKGVHFDELKVRNFLYLLGLICV